MTATDRTTRSALVGVHAGAGHRRAEAQRIAQGLGLTFVNDPAAVDLLLVLGDDGWSLRDPKSRGDGVRCDLTAGELGRRLREAARRGPTRRDRLARALGLPGPPLRVLDTTAGLGRESVLAAAFGCEVIACERSSVVALLLRDGLTRAATLPELEKLVARIQVRAADARDVMTSLIETERPDVVMVDPMFPERRKAARAKQEMQLLQQLLGEQPEEGPALLDAALSVARKRVVVKRPAHAPPVEGDRNPDIVIPGRASRYDVYLAR